MNEKCFDSGTIQAFLDGELTPPASLNFTNHIAVCDACAAALAEAEEETALVFAALDGEFNSLVPTQRLWTKINESIAEEKRKTPFLQSFWSFISVSLANPSITVAAGILIVAGLFTAVLTLRPDQQNQPMVAVNQSPKTSPIPAEVVNPIDAPVKSPREEKGIAPVRVRTKQSDSRETEIRRMIVKTDYREPVTPKNPDIKTPPIQKTVYLPGEDSYVKTIATLSETVASQKDAVLRPSQRVAFERDLAVVEDSIKKMQKEVRKNPKNESAKTVLYAAYQNKIDLLNSVAERSELMASLK